MGNLVRHARESRMLEHAGRGMRKATLIDPAKAKVRDKKAVPTREPDPPLWSYRGAQAHLCLNCTAHSPNFHRERLSAAFYT